VGLDRQRKGEKRTRTKKKKTPGVHGEDYKGGVEKERKKSCKRSMIVSPDSTEDNRKKKPKSGEEQEKR